MKKTIKLFILAFALLLGLTQCKKKDVETTTTGDLGEAVYITVNVGDGDRHIVYPGTGAVVYTDGDVIYVGNNGKYIGTLTYADGAFSGIIYGPSTEDYLHFYFVGGLTPSITPNAGFTTSFAVSIADQSAQLPVLSYGRSTVKYTDASTTYGCTLLNKCGLVKFVPSIATPETVTVGGMKSTAIIDFANSGIAPMAATGNVTLYAENDATKWAVLLPQDEVSTPEIDIDGYYSTTTSVPAITENYYNKDGVAIAMTLLVPPVGSAGGPDNAKRFNVSAGRYVWFSQGNLQAVFTSAYTSASTCTWKFADNQYDCIGSAVANTQVGNNLVTQAGTVDLFGWVGANSSLPAYGINNNGIYSDYGYTINESLKADWGHNPISNGGNVPDLWRTLTSAEWTWILGPRNEAIPGTNCRESSTVNNVQNARFAKATVNNVAGIILFPDKYTHPDGVTQPTNINDYTNNYFGNTYKTTQWSSMETAGCVFLPVTGYRNGVGVYRERTDGLYWSSTAHDTHPSNAYSIYFTASSFESPFGGSSRYLGASVRLVSQAGK